jgi:hypothetical protein
MKGNVGLHVRTGTAITVSQDTADHDQGCLDEVFARVKDGILCVGDVKFLRKGMC